MHVSLQLLGPLEARCRGQPVSFATNAARALLAYLAVESDRPHPRLLLAALLWPDQARRAASANIRQTLFRLRKALADAAAQDLVQISQHMLQFDRAGAEVDVLRFEELLAETQSHGHADLVTCSVCVERLEQALALYRGEFLQGLFLEQSEPFGEWQQFKREQLHRQALHALHTLARAAEATTDYPLMQRYAGRQLALEPWREAAHVQYMRALAAPGERAAALAHYGACCQVLNQELGMAPSPELRALAKQIAEGTFLPEGRMHSVASVSNSNLPAQLTALIGRERDLAALAAMLRGDVERPARIVTLTGPGGMGKTRLALHVAAAARDRFRDGVRFVNLAQIGDATLVMLAIAKALDVKEVAGDPLIETLKRYLHDQEILLLLDNFEQVRAAAPQVSQLVRATRGVKLLITSRIPLRITGEREYPVPSLALPDVANRPPIEEITRYAAVQLFAARAADVNPSFQVTDENALAVADICVALDGLPLAIELAAARMRSLTPQLMLAKLKPDVLSGDKGRLRLLTGGLRDVAARQQTLQASLEWSYDLLRCSEQQLFQRLAVFAGGCSLAAVEAVCGVDSTRKMSILDQLEALVRSSLVRQTEGADGHPRFNMLETIREFACEKLEASGEIDELRRRHAGYVVELVEAAGLDLYESKVAEWIDLLQPEYDNVRAALKWAREGMEHGHAERTGIGLRLAAAFWPFWYVRGHWREGNEWLALVLSHGEAVTGDRVLMRARARVLHGSGVLAILQGDYAAGRGYLEASVQAYNAVGDARNSAVALGRLGDSSYGQGNYASARRLVEQALAQAQGVNDKPLIASFLTKLGELMRAQGEYAAARGLIEDALAVLAALPGRDMDSATKAIILANLGNAAQREGQCDRAVAHLIEALALAERSGHRQAVMLCLRGEPERAARLFGAADRLLEALGAHLWPADRRDYEHFLVRTRDQLDMAAFDRARREGRRWSLAQSIAYAQAGTTGR